MKEPLYFIVVFKYFNIRPWLAEFNKIFLLSDLIYFFSSLYDLIHASSNDVSSSCTPTNLLSDVYKLNNIFLISSRFNVMLVALRTSFVKTSAGRCWYFSWKMPTRSFRFSLLSFSVLSYRGSFSSASLGYLLVSHSTISLKSVLNISNVLLSLKTKVISFF